MVELNLTKRQQEIFDFIKRYGGGARLSAHGPGHRQGDRPDLVVDGARPPRQPGEGGACCAAIPTKPRALEILVDKAKQAVAPAGCRSWARSPPASRCSPRRTSRSTCLCPAIAGGDEGEFILRVKGDSMKDAGILEGDHVVVRRQDTAARRRDRRGAGRARRPRSSASSRRRTTCGSSRRTRRSSRSASATSRCWAAS